MKLTDRFEKALLPLGLVLAGLVIVAGTLKWPLVLDYALTALMFAAFFGARSVDRRKGRNR
ncbi:MAG TPA: hypothetical protein VFU94_13905 [Conexibacter sp.]|nr:hypothetical protein [Conexibacter sp.]